MKTELNIKDSADKQPEFPAFYRSKENGAVVWFTKLNKGVLVNGHDNLCSLGSQIGCWTDCTNESNWERLPAGSSVTLIQE